MGARQVVFRQMRVQKHTDADGSHETRITLARRKRTP
jgi:hypothetical protein